VAKSKKPAKAKIELIEVKEPPKIPTLSFRGMSSAFSSGGNQKAKSFIPKTFRVTQHKGGGGK